MEYLEGRSSSLKPTHVYISFRGDDVGTSKFIRSLSASLKAQGLRIFGDDKRLETPHSYLPDHLRQAIDESWLWIAVFSKSYVSSSWCLQELENFVSGPCCCLKGAFLCAVSEPLDIVEYETWLETDIEKMNRWRLALKKTFGNRSVEDRMIAVFYDVDPKSFAKHILQTSEYREEIKYVANRFRGWHEWNGSSGSQVIPKIVKQVRSKIDRPFYDVLGFVGIQSQVEEAEKLLDLSTDDDEVQVLGICGMGGLGKSSIAAVLYLKIFHRFDAFCFVSNVSGRLKQGDLSLQQLLRGHLETENSEMWDFLGQEFLACERLRKHKFLIVLDGVDLAQHLQELNLVEKSNCFGGGSRIIITTRDEQVLQKYEVDPVYRPKLLSKDEAFKLFCSNAFTKEYPISGFKEMIERVLEYANGLPLAIETLGSYLFGKGAAEWRSFLMGREEIIPPYEIIRVLRKSFDELDDMNKEMFLDIACFFVGKDINSVKEILNDCGHSVDKGIKLLIQKSIITIANQRIQMHSMLQAMGREIIRRKCPQQPELRCRLYLFSDIRQVMEKERKMAIRHVKAIALDLEEPKWDTLKIEALSDMINLRLLIFRNVKFSGTLNNLSSKLRYVSWHQYPFTGLPSSFQSDRLVQLIMPESNMEEVWKGKLMLPKLRKMNLSGSINLRKTPDFGGNPNLETLELEGCIGLLQLDPSIGNLSNLKFVNLRGCINLVSVPNSLFSLSSLELLNLAGCSQFAHYLKFSPVKSFIIAKLLSTRHSPFLERLLYFF